MIGLGAFQMTLALSGITQTVDIFKAKLGWDDDETTLNNTTLNSIAIIGITIGSFSGGLIIKKGRRRANLIVNVLIIISSIISMWL